MPDVGGDALRIAVYVLAGIAAIEGGALVVLATVFFMWGFATVLNDILVPHLKAVFALNYGQSLLIQFVFYLAYLLMSLPGARLLERIGYKPSIVFGLLGMAGSALLFVPAAAFESRVRRVIAYDICANALECTLRPLPPQAWPLPLRRCGSAAKP